MGYSEWERRQWLNSLLLWSYQNINNNNNEKKTFLSSLAWNRVAICLLAMWPKKPSRIYDEMEGKQAGIGKMCCSTSKNCLLDFRERKKKFNKLRPISLTIIWLTAVWIPKPISKATKTQQKKSARERKKSQNRTEHKRATATIMKHKKCFLSRTFTSLFTFALKHAESEQEHRA